MFGLGAGELLIIAIVALLALGPDKLPGAAKKIGQGIRDLKRQTRDLQDSLEQDTQIGEAVRDLKSALRGDEVPRRRPPGERPPPERPPATRPIPPAATNPVPGAGPVAPTPEPAAGSAPMTPDAVVRPVSEEPAPEGSPAADPVGDEPDTSAHG